MKPELLAVLLAGLGFVGQGINVFLNLRIRNAMLEQEKEQRNNLDVKLKDYVLKETCRALTARAHRAMSAEMPAED